MWLATTSVAFDGGGGQGFGRASQNAARGKKKQQKKSASSGFASTTQKNSAASRGGHVRPTEDRRPRGKLSPRRVVPDSIMRPVYAKTGIPPQSMKLPWQIEKKSQADVEKMRVSGRFAREVLDEVGRHVRPGITGDELDAVAHEAAVSRGAYPSPLNYYGFPKSVCVSVNEIICHGIPDDITLKDGDIVNIDVTVFHDGFHGDCSEMFYVGDGVDDASKNLVQVTYDAWQAAIDFCAPGKAYKEIGGVIEDVIKPHGYSSVKAFVGHGIGRDFHENPNVLHYRNNEANGVMDVGHVFTIEPMICEGKQDHEMWDDEWTVATLDLGRSAQFEHTLLLTKDGAVPLTGKLPTSPVQPWEKKSPVLLGA